MPHALLEKHKNTPHVGGCVMHAQIEIQENPSTLTFFFNDNLVIALWLKILKDEFDPN